MLWRCFSEVVFLDAKKRSEYNHRYYVDSKAYLSKYHKDRWQRIKDARKESMRQYFARNIEMYGAEQAVIKEVRLKMGISQRALGEIIGVTATAISFYESGRVKAPWDKLTAAMPELEEARNGL